jgi:adenosylhomocysteinase
VELELPALRKASVAQRMIRDFVEEFTLKDGRRIYVLAEGRLINLAAAEGHPSSVMDMSFANQALSAEYMAKEHMKLQKKVYPVPGRIDREIARLKLESMNVEIDTLTAEQEKYCFLGNGNVTTVPFGSQFTALGLFLLAWWPCTLFTR